jgi:hypothetical protein
MNICFQAKAMGEMLKGVKEKQAKEIALLATEMERLGSTKNESAEPISKRNEEFDALVKENSEIKESQAQQKLEFYRLTKEKDELGQNIKTLKEKYKEEIDEHNNLSGTEVSQRKLDEDLEKLRNNFEKDLEKEKKMWMAEYGEVERQANDSKTSVRHLCEMMKQYYNAKVDISASTDTEKRCKELEEEKEKLIKQIETQMDEINKLGKARKEETKVEKSPNGFEKKVSELEAENKLLKMEIQSLLSSDNPCTSSDGDKRCKELEEEKVKLIKQIEKHSDEVNKMDKARKEETKVEKSPTSFERKVFEMEGENKLLKIEIQEERNQDKIKIEELMEQVEQKGHESNKLRDEIGKFV